MIKMSKKIVGVIAGSSAVLIAGATVTANILLKDEIGQVPNTNPLNRDRSYHYFSIGKQVKESINLNDLVNVVPSEHGITYIIEEEKFLKNFKNIVQEALSKISTFKDDYLSYIIDCHYKINTKSVSVDLVWYQPDAKNKFFDQIEIILQTA